MTALDDLIDAVDRGGISTDLIMEAFGNGWDDVLVLAAFDGSLDAAKALHEEVLGDGYIGSGYLYCIWGSGKASVWENIDGAVFRADVPQRELHAESPARAWLLAILKAYRAQQVAG
jgi:hypothetical protein